MIAGEAIAIDGTKSQAENSKKANFNQNKIDKQLAYFEERTQEYLDETAKNNYYFTAKKKRITNPRDIPQNVLR